MFFIFVNYGNEGLFHCFGGGLFFYFSGGVAAKKFALVYEADFGAAVGFVEIGSRYKNCYILLLQIVKDFPEVAAGDGVNAVCRLI